MGEGVSRALARDMFLGLERALQQTLHVVHACSRAVTPNEGRPPHRHRGHAEYAALVPLPQPACVFVLRGAQTRSPCKGARFHSTLRSPLYLADDAENSEVIVVIWEFTAVTSSRRNES